MVHNFYALMVLSFFVYVFFSHPIISSNIDIGVTKVAVLTGEDKEGIYSKFYSYHFLKYTDEDKNTTAFINSHIAHTINVQISSTYG